MKSKNLYFFLLIIGLFSQVEAAERQSIEHNRTFWFAINNTDPAISKSNEETYLNGRIIPQIGCKQRINHSINLNELAATLILNYRGRLYRGPYNMSYMDNVDHVVINDSYIGHRYYISNFDAIKCLTSSDFLDSFNYIPNNHNCFTFHDDTDTDDENTEDYCHYTHTGSNSDSEVVEVHSDTDVTSID